jgi:hypothetical protein
METRIDWLISVTYICFASIGLGICIAGLTGRTLVYAHIFHRADIRLAKLALRQALENYSDGRVTPDEFESYLYKYKPFKRNTYGPEDKIWTFLTRAATAAMLSEQLPQLMRRLR